jgi:hypothetical protein
MNRLESKIRHTLQDLADAVEPPAFGLEMPTPLLRQVRRRRGRTSAVALMVATAIAAAAIAGVRFLPRAEPRPADRPIKWFPGAVEFRLLYAHRMFLYRVNGDGSSVLLGSGGENEPDLNGDPLSWSPDLSKVIVVRPSPCGGGPWTQDNQDGPLRHQYLILNADGSGEVRIAGLSTLPCTPPGPQRLRPAFEGRPDLEVVGFVWAPDGSKIAIADRSVVHIVSSSGEERLRLPGSAVLGWSKDGTRLMVYDGQRIILTNEDGTDARTITTGVVPEGAQPTWSSDDQQVAIAVMRGRPAEGDGKPIRTSILVADVGTSNVSKLVDVDGSVQAQAWAPDGSTLAFATFVSDPSQSIGGVFLGRWQVWSIRSDGTRLTRLAASEVPGGEGNAVLGLHWAPSGSALGFIARDPNGRQGLYAVHPDGTGLTRLALLPGPGIIGFYGLGPFAWMDNPTP